MNLSCFSGGAVVMDNEKCLEMFQNIKKQISDQSVFNLTGLYQSDIESETESEACRVSVLIIVSMV